MISHNEILDLYKKYIDPAFTYKNFSLEEQAKVLAAGRSNNELDATKLVTKCKELGLEVPPIQESIVHVFERMRVNLGLNCCVCFRKGSGKRRKVVRDVLVLGFWVKVEWD